MSKPKTTYTKLAKPTTTFSKVPKNATSYIPSAADAAALKWLLNSVTVTLNSVTAYLNGYFTPTVPSQLNNKPRTTYTPV